MEDEETPFVHVKLELKMAKRAADGALIDGIVAGLFAVASIFVVSEYWSEKTGPAFFIAAAMFIYSMLKLTMSWIRHEIACSRGRELLELQSKS